MNRAWLLVSILVAVPAAGEERYQGKRLTAAEAKADVALLRRTLETVHPGLYRYRTKAEIDAAFTRLERAASHPIDDLSLWRAVARIVAEVRCDHTKPEPSVAIETWRDEHPTMMPLRFALVEGRMIVLSSDGQPGAPPRGAEILEINGRAVTKVVGDLAAAVSYDGTTDHAVAAKLAADVASLAG